MNSSSDVPVGRPVSVLDACATPTADPARVLATRSGMPDGASLDEVAAVFGLLSDPGRLRLLGALRTDELCVCDLAAVSGQSESATSHALRLLRAYRVVQVRRVGRRAYYRLDDGHVRGLLDLALAHVDHAAAPAPPGHMRAGEGPA